MAKKEKSLFRQLLEERGIKDLAGVHALVKELTSDFIQEAMDAELEEELGYSKYDYKNKQTDISSIEDKIIFLYSRGVSTRDIERTMQEMYGIEVDATRVSKITDKLLLVIREWQNRPLESVYAMVMLDAIHYKVREDGMVVKKAVYIATGTDLQGEEGCPGSVGQCDGKLEILAGRSEWPEEPWRFGHPDCIGGRTDRLHRGNRRGIPQDGGAALHRPPDTQFHPVCVLQGRQGVHGGAQAHL